MQYDASIMACVCECAKGTSAHGLERSRAVLRCGATVFKNTGRVQSSREWAFAQHMVGGRERRHSVQHCQMSHGAGWGADAARRCPVNEESRWQRSQSRRDQALTTKARHRSTAAHRRMRTRHFCECRPPNWRGARRRTPARAPTANRVMLDANPPRTHRHQLVANRINLGDACQNVLPGDVHKLAIAGDGVGPHRVQDWSAAAAREASVEVEEEVRERRVARRSRVRDSNNAKSRGDS